MIANLKSKSEKKSNDINTYVSSMRRLSDHADQVLTDYTNTKAELQRLSKVKKSTEKTKMVEISRLCSENQKLMDKVRKGWYYFIITLILKKVSTMAISCRS